MEIVDVQNPIQVQIDEVYPYYRGAKIEGETITPYFVTQMFNNFKDDISLHPKFAYQILLQTKDLLINLPSLVDITVPHGKNITVCGDIHGQFYDLANIFEINGFPSNENPYVFNGDLVNRGCFSLEVILTLFAFKCLYPNAMHIARGNHESQCMTKLLGLENEVERKLNRTFIGLFRQVFCCLPLAHVINNKVFVTHGGLFSREGVKLSDIRGIDRFCEPPDEGLMCELLWSDPKEGRGRSPSMRGFGVAFGEDVTKKFLDENELDLVVRSHEMKDEGYEIVHDGKLVTIFSAPNFCKYETSEDGNKGAFIRFQAPELKPDNVVQYSAVPVPHPDICSVHYIGFINTLNAEN